MTRAGIGVIRAAALAGLLLGPNDEGIRRDYVRVAERWLAGCGPFEHAESGKANAEAHLLSAFGGTRLLLTVSAGRLDLGTWQRLFVVELFAAAAEP